MAVECSNCESSVEAWVTLWSHPDILICYECLDYLNRRRDRQIAAHGGLKPLAGFDPIFNVRDVERAVDHYQRLGFTTDYHDATYAFARWGNLSIHLAQADEPDAHATSALYIHVDDADDVAAEWRKAGMDVVGPENQDYGKREGRHVDPDGNLIRFGGPPRSD
ncbi:MAG TPA: VOC family protein [Acidimicrobiia bacterium]|jgi:catechol 2,3-dioxygenase-like lactoylglutathione lyase family enzyme